MGGVFAVRMDAEAKRRRMMNEHPRPTEWRGPDKPAQPGVHVVAYVTVALGLTLVAALVWALA